MPSEVQTRIGILGGTFNPIHMGHLVMAQDALELFQLNQVLFIPCAVPAHKRGAKLASPDHRLAMLRAALADDRRFAVSTIELERDGVSYSIDTVRELQRRQPAVRFVFIIGGDTLPELHTWRNIGDLLELCDFVTMARPGVPREYAPANLCLPEPWPARLIQNARVGHLVDVSSSEIRARVARGQSIRYLVPYAVEMYILNHDLYAQED